MSLSRPARITWIISDIHTSFQMEHLLNELNLKFSISFVLINMEGSPLDQLLLKHERPITYLTIKRRFDYLKAIFKCIMHFRNQATSIVHCQLLKANIVGLISARLVNVKRRIYTRHHSTFHHLYSQKGVFLDRFLNSLATDIIAISVSSRDVLLKLEQVRQDKIHLIPHGFDFNSVDHMFSVKGIDYTEDRSPVIGVVSRLIDWKGIQFVIPAFEKILKTYPDALLLIAGAQGPFEKEIFGMLDKLPFRSFKVIRHEENIYSLYKQIDVFVHVPIDSNVEAYGQTYVEALGVGVPSVLTLSGIANEFVVNESNALVVDYQDSADIYQSLLKLLSDPELASRLGKQARKDVRARYTLESQIEQLRNLYL